MAEPQRRTEFDRRYKAGFWTSRIDTQDQVATIVATEALGGVLELVPANILDEAGRIAFEAREDFEIRWNGGRQYVSVKDKQVDRKDVCEAISKLQTLRTEVVSVAEQSLRLECASLTSSARSLYEDIARLRDLRKLGSGDDYVSAASEFESQHGIDSTVAERVIISERRIGRSPEVSAAIFAFAVRNAVRVHNFGDSELTSIFVEFSGGIFRDRRQGRSILILSEYENLLLSPLIPISISVYQTDYLHTEFGYLRDRDQADSVKAEAEIVRRFGKALMREWRRKTFKDRVKDSLYRGHIGCLACGHPMIANFNGRNGLACPDCGYQPFLTMFYACDCGSGAVVERQPSLSSYAFVRDAVRLLRTGTIRCMGCGKTPVNEFFMGRLFTLPIPYPVEGYPGQLLISWREDLGWRDAKKFCGESGGELTPRESLQRLRRSES